MYIPADNSYDLLVSPENPARFLADLQRADQIMLRSTTILSLACILGSCRTTPAPSPPAPQAQAPATPPAEPEAPQESPSETVEAAPTDLLVGGQGGVRLLSPDGELIRTLTKTPAIAPRWRPGRTQLVFLDTEGNLRSLDRDGHESLIAPLPRELPCPADAYDPGGEPNAPLGLNMDEEFWISGDDTHACITLSDAFPNMRLAQRDVAVALADGTVSQQIVFGGSECGVTEYYKSLAGCDRPYAEPPEVTSPISGGVVESFSPDGAWTLVLVGSELADVLHLQYVLVRARDGAVFPMPYEAGPWPKRISLPAEVDSETLLPDVPDMQGGETVAWVGPHHVVLDRVLYVAGERIVELEGELAP